MTSGAIRKIAALTLLCSLGSIAMSIRPAPAEAATSWTPAFNQDLPDPAILVDGTGYVAYSTQVGFMDTPDISSADTTDWSGYRDAMPGIPSWASSGSTWAPSVARNAAGEYVEFYAAQDPGFDTHCLGRAVSFTPSGPFVDTSTSPFLCQANLGGSIDPSVFTAGSGQHYLLWKSDGNSIGMPSRIWSAPIDPDLDQLTGSPVAVLNDDQSWQDGVVENPDMVEVNGSFHLFYSGGPYFTASYATGVADCASPLGPCTDGSDNPVLTERSGHGGSWRRRRLPSPHPASSLWRLRHGRERSAMPTAVTAQCTWQPSASTETLRCSLPLGHNRRPR